ncbi:MAG: cytochrome c peroxidase, partial [Gammaproteobacteria bacterium]
MHTTFVRLGLVSLTLLAGPALAQFIEDAAPPPPSLKELEIPPVTELISGKPLVDESFDGAGGYIKDLDAAILLGKAMFWDTQSGSNGEACATCHYHAGSDNRSKNQLNPGTNGGDGVFNLTRSGGLGANYDLNAADFPFHELADPVDRESTVLFDTDDVASSQGTFAANFDEIKDGKAKDKCSNISPDPFGFHVNNINVRRVEPRNTPTIINAVFNFRNFWDGRANNIFNGVDAFGSRSANARILEVQGGGVVQAQVAFQNASLASQAVAPPISDFEMSCFGRVFPDIGKKMLSLEALAKQKVHPDDSVLGGLSAWPKKGLTNGGKKNPVYYEQLIQAAFADRLWNSNARFDADKNEVANGDYSMTEANFSLFWGLAIQAYETTLISDNTPFDQFQEGDENALTELEQEGMELFFTNDPARRANCSSCHQGPTFSTAMFPFAEVESGEFPEQEQIVERMRMGDGFDLLENLLRYQVIGEGSVGGFLLAGKAGSRELPDIYPATVGGDFSINGCGDYRVTSFLMNQDITAPLPPGSAPPPPGPHPNADYSTRDAVFTLEPTGGCAIGLLQVTIIDNGPIGDTATIAPILVPQIKPPFSPPIPPVVGPPMVAGVVQGDFKLHGGTLYDTGFYNIGIRETAEDPGIGGTDPYGNPLSFTRQIVNEMVGTPAPDELFAVNWARVAEPFNWDADAVFYPGGFEGYAWLTHSLQPNPAFPDAFCTEPDPPFPPAPAFQDQVSCEAAGKRWFVEPEFTTQPVFFPPGVGTGRGDEAIPANNAANYDAILNQDTAVAGAFKVSQLRNVDLTGPYFHNGGQLTLRQVVEFYNRGGDFALENIGDLSPFIRPLDLSSDDMDAIVAFLSALTDQRVRCELAPFDHPEIKIARGIKFDDDAWDDVDSDSDSDDVKERFEKIPATGAGGRPANNDDC